jgi:hypothetical protein
MLKFKIKLGIFQPIIVNDQSMNNVETKPEVNPFSPKESWSFYESIKFYIIGPIMVPIKVILLIILLGMINVLCRIALYGFKKKINIQRVHTVGKFFFF